MKPLFTTLLAIFFAQHVYGQELTIAQLRTQLAVARYDTVRVRLYDKLAQRYSESTYPDSAFILATKGIPLASHYHMLVEESSLYQSLSYYYKRTRNLLQAQTILEKALKLVQKTNDTALRCQILYRLTCLYCGQGAYHKTIETATVCLRLAEQLKDSIQMCCAYQLLAMAHQHTQNRLAALSYATKEFQLAQQVVVRHPDQQIYLLQAEQTFVGFYEASGQYTKAYPYLKKSFDYAVAHNDPLQIAELTIRLGNNLVRQKRPQEALNHLDRSFRPAWVNHMNIVGIYNVYALAHQQLGHTGLALGYARKAYRQSLRAHFLRDIQETMTILISIEESQKMYSQALAHSRQLAIINDSLFTTQKSRAIAEVEAKYRLSQKEQAITLLEKDAALREIRLGKNRKELEIRRQQQLFLVLFTLTLLLLVGVLVIVFRRERIHSRLLATQKAATEEKADQLLQLNKLKDSLFSIISHDLRSPVVSLQNELILNQPRTLATFAQWRNRMKAVTDALYTTLDNLLHWSRLQQHNLKGIARPVDLSLIINDVLELHTSLAHQKQIHLNLKAVPTVAIADENFIQVVIRNVLHNAIKFTPVGGEIHINVWQTDQQAQVSVVDHGLGMVWVEPWYIQAKPGPVSVGTIGEKGTGLGLLLCYELMTRNNGQLQIQSAPGQGTTVTLSWPLAEPR